MQQASLFDFEVPPVQVGLFSEEEVKWSIQDLRALADGLIRRSIRLIRDYPLRSKTFVEEAAWFFDEDQTHPLSVVNCAELALLDLTELRRGLDFSLSHDKRRYLRLLDNGEYENSVHHEMYKNRRGERNNRPAFNI